MELVKIVATLLASLMVLDKGAGVLSPILFTIYIDKLLLELHEAARCWMLWNFHFANAYA